MEGTFLFFKGLAVGFWIGVLVSYLAREYVKKYIRKEKK
jgi:hypothetical protein